MQRSTKEIEIKLPFETVEAAHAKLSTLGAKQRRPREFEDNLVFDRTDGALERHGVLLRVRRVGDRSILTLKLPVEGTHRHKIREEHETTLGDADAMRRVLEGLGFRVCYRYQKYRTVYELEQLTICLDETPFGCYVELEGEAGAIDRTAARLGFQPGDYVLDTYLDLQEKAVRERGLEAGDLLFR